MFGFTYVDPRLLRPPVFKSWTLEIRGARYQNFAGAVTRTRISTATTNELTLSYLFWPYYPLPGGTRSSGWPACRMCREAMAFGDVSRPDVPVLALDGGRGGASAISLPRSETAVRRRRRRGTSSMRPRTGMPVQDGSDCAPGAAARCTFATRAGRCPPQCPAASGGALWAGNLRWRLPRRRGRRR